MRIEIENEDTESLHKAMQLLFEPTEYGIPRRYNTPVTAWKGKELVGAIVTLLRDNEITIVTHVDHRFEGIATAMLVALERLDEDFHAIAGSEGGAAALWALAYRLGRIPRNISWAGYDQE